MAKVHIVLRHDYESGDSHAGEFSSPTKIVGVFTKDEDAYNFVEKEYEKDGGGDPGDLPYGFEVEEHEVT